MKSLMEEIERICEEVLKRVEPGDEERRRIAFLANHIRDVVDEKARDLGIPAHAVIVGSTARGTWLSGEGKKDIDIFMMMPVHLTEDQLREYGLRIAEEVCKSLSYEYEERYASHPYVHAWFEHDGDEYEVDFVPSFEVSDPRSIKSAVDRTPFHNEYISRRIKGLEREVLLLKQFLKGAGIYGSEERVLGFSGYLCELLILKYSSFVNLLRHASSWKYGEFIHIEPLECDEREYKRRYGEPLIVVDPVDPKRNVAAAVSIESFSKLIDASREFLDRPSMHFFFPEKIKPMSGEEFLKKLKGRKTDIVVVLFDAPDVTDDILFPQLRKALSSVSDMIERHGFRIFRCEATVIGDEGERRRGKKRKCVLLFEMEVSTLPNVRIHVGPPVTSREHSRRFKNKHRVIRIRDGRYIAEVQREYREVDELIRGELIRCSLGKHISEDVKASGYEVRRNEEIL